jgi:hypothetical protein
MTGIISFLILDRQLIKDKMQDNVTEWSDREDIALGGVSLGKNGPSELEATLLYTEICLPGNKLHVMHA